jgi:hypothetical protein
VQVEEELVAATVVEESVAPPPPATVIVIEEEWTVMEITAPQATLEPSAGAGTGGEDVVMVPADDGLVPSLPAREHDAATSTAPESSIAEGAASVEGATDLSSSRYVDFPGIGTIDLDVADLPSNDREMLEVAMEQMFADLSILDTITSTASALCQDEGAGVSVPPAAPEAAEGVLGESSDGTESVVIMPLPTSDGEGMGASLSEPAEAVTIVPTASVIGAAKGVVGGAKPSSPRPAATVVEEVLVPSQPSVAPRERDALKGVTRAASPKIQEAEMNSSTALLQGAGSGETQILELASTPWAATFEAGDDTEDDEEAAACNTLERRLVWARRAFGELILPATSVSFLAWVTCFSDFPVLPRTVAHLRLVRGRPSRRLVGGERAQHESFAWSRLSWRCSSSWLEWRQLQRWQATHRRGRPLKPPSSPRRTAPLPPRPLALQL